MHALLPVSPAPAVHARAVRLGPVLPAALLLCGCGALRLAPGEVQKQNAYLHIRTAALAAETARAEGAPGPLQALTALSAAQSEALGAHYGPPEVAPPAAPTVADVLSPAVAALVPAAAAEAAARPAPWDLADGLLEAGIAVTSLFTGLGAVRIAGFLRLARAGARPARSGGGQ